MEWPNFEQRHDSNKTSKILGAFGQSARVSSSVQVISGVSSIFIVLRIILRMSEVTRFRRHGFLPPFSSARGDSLWAHLMHPTCHHLPPQQGIQSTAWPSMQRLDGLLLAFKIPVHTATAMLLPEPIYRFYSTPCDSSMSQNHAQKSGYLFEQHDQSDARNRRLTALVRVMVIHDWKQLSLD